MAARGHQPWGHSGFSRAGGRGGFPPNHLTEYISLENCRHTGVGRYPAHENVAAKRRQFCCGWAPAFAGVTGKVAATPPVDFGLAEAKTRHSGIANIADISINKL